MLVLSRKVDESVYLELEDGRRIEVCVVEIRGDKVRLGIDAPGAIGVHRSEVMRAIDAEQGRPPMPVREPMANRLSRSERKAKAPIALRPAAEQQNRQHKGDS